jgi:HlyD family secretion protein/adhesin transport system membrane fusion protein
MDILPLEEAAIASERALARAEIERRMGSLANLQAMKKTMATTLGLANEELDAQRTLAAKGLASRSVLLATERDAAEAALDLAEVEGQIAETEATILEARRRLEDVIASRRQRHGDQLSSLMIDLGELEQQIPALQQRLARGAVRAPANGIVQKLDADLIGQVISPGDKLLESLLIDSPLVIEARLPTTEIGHVAPGQTVRIAVDGIEPHRAGYLGGHVEKLSPSTFIDEDGAPYYRALITLTNDELDGTRLIPGMTVQAQIKTGQRTILEYLLKPVYRAWDTAFRER